ncbi:hypothetical protein VZT92_000276 [Zoarces viviparus]|uniref:Uncharacterized protein n=1 Tax=Zoarces viviparus TaxID=48416 RepID=A0AAW1G8Z2_ZOAVI
MEKGHSDDSANSLIMLRLASNGTRCAGVSGSALVTALLSGEQRACQRGLNQCCFSRGLELAGPLGQEHPTHLTNTSLYGVINHLAPDSSSVERSHLGWRRWLLH